MLTDTDTIQVLYFIQNSERQTHSTCEGNVHSQPLESLWFGKWNTKEDRLEMFLVLLQCLQGPWWICWLKVFLTSTPSHHLGTLLLLPEVFSGHGQGSSTKRFFCLYKCYCYKLVNEWKKRVFNSPSCVCLTNINFLSLCALNKMETKIYTTVPVHNANINKQHARPLNCLLQVVNNVIIVYY